MTYVFDGIFKNEKKKLLSNPNPYNINIFFTFLFNPLVFSMSSLIYLFFTVYDDGLGQIAGRIGVST